MNDRLFRSRTDRVIAGVCGGIADRFDLDPSLVRVGYAILWLFSGIVPFTVVYVLMAIVVPEEPGGAWAAPGTVGPPPGGPTFSAPPAAGEAQAADASAVAGTAAAGAGGTADDAAGGPPSWAAAAPADDWRARRWADRDARRAARRAARAERRSDPLGAIIVGLILVSVGAWFLLRNVVTIEWDLVWPAALVALGVVLVVVAVLPRPGRR